MGYEFAFGLNFNRYSVNARQDRSGIGIDGGLLLMNTPHFFPQIGVMLSGLSQGFGFDDDEDEQGTIPLRVNLGIAYHLLRDRLTLAGGFSKTSGDSSWQYAIGGEYQVRRFYPIHLSIRGGYRFRGSRSEEGGDIDVNGWNPGLSLYINRLKLDYSFEPHTYLGDTHRMTISILPNTVTEIYWQRGLGHNAMLEDDAALETFQQLVELNPRSAKAYHRMALIYERQRHIAGAIDTLEHVKEIDVDYFTENGLQQLIDDLGDQRVSTRNASKR